MESRPIRALGALFLTLVVAASVAAGTGSGAAVPRPPIPATVATSLRALDCGRLEGIDARITLAGMPAPRIISLQGSVPLVTMEPFSRFLIAMGYPEAALRDPDGALTTSSYLSSETLAGNIAWYYEREGLRPMLIGHSQGGMLVVRTLHELGGRFHEAIQVVNPATGAVEPRTSVRDPYSGNEVPVVGLRVAFAAALATGALPRLLLGQWSMLPILRRIPDTVDEFTGIAVAWDPIAGNLATASPYIATGSAAVRNVLLPASYSHVGLPRTEHLAAQPATRTWIEAWGPGSAAETPDLPDADVSNLLHAADLWTSVRRHWCLEGQRWLRAYEPD